MAQAGPAHSADLRSWKCSRGSVEGGGGAAAPEDLQAQQVKAQACPTLSSWTVLSVHRHVSKPVTYGGSRTHVRR